MKMKSWFVFILLTMFGTVAIAQESGKRGRQMPQGNGTLRGVVLDEQSGLPLEYANIVVYRMRNSEMVTGTVTDPDGSFLIDPIPYGAFIVEANFIGYKKTEIDSVLVLPRRPDRDIGEIRLKPAGLNLDEVEITADKVLIEYKIDKKVVNVSQDLKSAGGTAADVLENTPSVDVDIEGNVSLRGSSNFTVLINGRPGVLQGSDALQQLPASQIDNIEIITNPSAKYDPEGTAGIINVIMKEEKNNGLTGLFNLGAGTKHKYKADFLLNYKLGDVNLYAGADYRDADFLMERTTDREIYNGDTTYHYKTEDDRIMHRGGSSAKLGLDWYLSEKTTLGISGDYGKYEFSFSGDGKNKEWITPGDSSFYYLTQGNLSRPREYYSLNANISHNFNDNGHKLIGMLHWNDKWGEGVDKTLEHLSDEHYNSLGVPLTSINTRENEKSDEFRMKLDYSNPFEEDTKLEAGLQMRLENEIQDYYFEEYVHETGWVENPEFSSRMDYRRDIYSAYITWQSSIWGLDYQMGLRGEYTNRSISDAAIENTYTIDRIDLFTSIHLSKQLPDDNQLMMSFSRRLNRPRGRYLDPFKIYIDANNLRQGNPNLKPEYVDSYELGWMKRFGQSFITVEGYYHLTHNAFTRVFKNYEGDVVIHTMENLNREHASGIEMMLNHSMGKKVNLNLNGSVYYYRLQGEMESGDIDKESINWRTNLMTTWKFLKNSRLQFRVGYRGANVTAQGEREGMLYTDLALRHDFLDNRFSITAQVRDLFGTSKRDFIQQTELLFEHTVMQREWPVLNLTLTYRLNNYKEEKSRPAAQEEGGMEMDYGY